MKILYVIGFYPNNPRNLKMIKNLKREYNIKCCFWNNQKNIIEKEDKKEYIFTSNKIKGKLSKFFNIFFFYKYLKKTVKEYNPDCIFAYHWDIFILVKMATIFDKKIKIVYDISDIPAYKGVLHKIIKRIEEFFIDDKVLLMFASPYFQEKYDKYVKNFKIVINNKPEMSFLEEYEKEKKEHKDLIISFFGVFRDFEVFKNIFLAAENLPIKLKMCGSGFEKENIEKYSKKFKNIYIGNKFKAGDLPKLYSDVNVILSLYSNKDENTKLALGNKFFESLILKKIGIFPKNTKMGEYILKKKLGFVVNPYDVEEIREVFISILNNSEYSKEIKQNLLNLEKEKLFYEYEIKKFLPLLEEFIKC